MPECESNFVHSALDEMIRQWWLCLQKERKCNFTNNIAKIVKKYSPDDQYKVSVLISKYIMESVSLAIQSNNIIEMLIVCNAVNGCFDNFPSAAEAVHISFNEIMKFVDVCIDKCSNELKALYVSGCSASKLFELIHCLSRILVLILKLKRAAINKCSSHSSDVHCDIKILLSKLSKNISIFLKMDEILMDSKCNFVMALLLIREIIVREKIKLIQYHDEFIFSIPDNIEEKDYKLHILQFLLSSAILNIWSDLVIDTQSVSVYLKFFIQLCENYSSDTAIILNISRSLLLLIKNARFKDFMLTVKDEDSHQISSLLSCIWMLLDHPVACVRHSSKDFLRLLVVYDKCSTAMRNSLSVLPSEKRSYFITLAALANEFGSRSLLQEDEELPKNLLMSAYDPTLVSHVIWALESMIITDSTIKSNFSEWCETWFVPLLMSLSNVPLVVAADIEKLLDSVFKRFPSAIHYVIRKWCEPKNDEELRFIITSLKIYHKHGFKMLTNMELMNQDIPPNSDFQEKKWRDLISEKLLMFCLHHYDDDIRISAFSLIVQGLKSTEVYTEQDFRLIRYFLIYNLNNQQACTRQKILSLMKKMLSRYCDSLVVLKRASKLTNTVIANNDGLLRYAQFEDWLLKFCFSNIFEGANFNRLNTVLSILLAYFEIHGHVKIKSCDAEIYWKKILIALRSSYEENKIFAVTLGRKLNIYKLLSEDLHQIVQRLFRRAYEICGKIEPPNVLTGAYLIQILNEYPNMKPILSEYLSANIVDNSVKLLCVYVLVSSLKEQVQNARKNFITAAIKSPMYGLLFTVRLIIGEVNFSGSNDPMTNSDEIFNENWKFIINDLIELCLNMTHIVSCVVNSSSPEGHLPSDFQTNFDLECKEGLHCTYQNLPNLNGEEAVELDLEAIGEQVEKMKFTLQQAPSEREIHESYWRLIKQFNRLYLSSNYTNLYSGKNLEDMKILLEESTQLLSPAVKIILNGDHNELSDVHHINSCYIQCLRAIKMKLENIIKTHTKNMINETKPTSQVLLLCSWRSIKEACLFLGNIVSKFPLEEAIECNLITEDMVIRIGQELKTLLCEIKHRGAFEQAYIGFIQLSNALWKCPRKRLHELPNVWLQEVLSQLKSPLENQKLKLCSTRRSAGLPFLVQALISSELQQTKSARIETLDVTVNTLLQILETNTNISLDSKIHSLNILRALFKHSMLGEHVAPYVSRALMVAIRGSRANAWSERNSSCLLYSSLVIRIFGVSRNKDSLSKKNRMTSKTFFQRYPELHEFFLSEMRTAFGEISFAYDCYPQPNVFLILLILGRLYPPAIEEALCIDFSEFIPLINISCRNAILKIRELGSRALVPLIPLEKLKEELDLRFSYLFSREPLIDNNWMHGVLLQIKEVLYEMSCNQSKLTTEILEERGSFWIKNSEWILSEAETEANAVHYFVKTTYLLILHIIFVSCPRVRDVIANTINRKKPFEYLDVGDARKDLPGYFLYLETLHFVRLDAAVHSWFESRDNDKMVELLSSMLTSELNEIQVIPLMFCHYITSDKTVECFADDSVNSISVEIQNLLCLQDEKHLNDIKGEILSRTEVTQCLVQYLISFLSKAENSSLFLNKVVTRLWFSVITTFMLNNIISVPELYMLSDKKIRGSLLNMDLFSPLLNCGDIDISVNAFLLYCIIFFHSIVNRVGDVNSDIISHFVTLLFSFSDPDSDIKQRAAVSKLFNRYYHALDHELIKNDIRIQSIYVLPLRLMVDDDLWIRRNTMSIVSKFHIHMEKYYANKKLLIKSEEIILSQLTTVPLKAQELLLDCYINIFGEKNVFNLVVQMVAWSLSACSNAINFESISGQNEIGVFEKGVPNPFCEELTFSTVICSKLKELSKLIDMKNLLYKKLDATHVCILRKFLPTLTLPLFPASLNELVEKIYYIFGEEEPEPENRAVSLLSVQIRQLNDSLYI